MNNQKLENTTLKLEEIRMKSFNVEFKKDNLIKFKKLNPDAVLPVKADKGSACYDLCSIEDIIIDKHSRALVHTGLAWQPCNNNIELQVRPRSGLALKHGITVLNSPGTVDASYRGEICVILINLSDTPYVISKGDRIAQAKIDIVPQMILIESDEINTTKRGTGGFGHSGK